VNAFWIPVKIDKTGDWAVGACNYAPIIEPLTQAAAETIADRHNESVSALIAVVESAKIMAQKFHGPETLDEARSLREALAALKEGK
jgi:hypothetical protein